MKSNIALTIALLLLSANQFVLGRGFGGGGGYHGGGGGFSGGGFSGGGYHGGGFDSGYHGGGFDSGYHPSSFDGGYHPESFGGYHPDSFSGYHPDAYAGGYHDYSGIDDAHIGLPTDAGFGAAGAAAVGSGAVARNVTQPMNSTHLAAQGAAVRNAFNGTGTFNGSWLADHPNAWNAVGWNNGNYWNWADWAAATGALGWGADVNPVFYDYGTNITYQDDQVYYGQTPIATTDQYYEQAAGLADSAPPTDAQSSNWTPLGVFALVQNDQDSPQFLIQFAVNKSGAVAGNYVDLLSDSVLPIHGAVDTKTQRMAWIVGNNKKNVGETGLYDLTKNESPVLIHHGSNSTQQWLLVRLKKPNHQS